MLAERGPVSSAVGPGSALNFRNWATVTSVLPAQIFSEGIHTKGINSPDVRLSQSLPSLGGGPAFWPATAADLLSAAAARVTPSVFARAARVAASAFTTSASSASPALRSATSMVSNEVRYERRAAPSS